MTAQNGTAAASAATAAERRDTTHTRSQRYLSTRGGSYGVFQAQLHFIMDFDADPI